MRKNNSPQNTKLDPKGCGCLISIFLGVLVIIGSMSSNSPFIVGMGIFLLVVCPIIFALWMHNDSQKEEQRKREADIAELRSQWKKEEEQKKKLQEGLESLGAPGGLEGISGSEFEKIITELFKKLGYTVSITKGSGDEGIDLFLEKEGLRAGVQCKRWKTMIGQRVVREFYGSLIHAKLKKGFVITTSRFSKAAKDFVRGKQVVLIDREELRRIILEDLSEALNPVVRDVSSTVSLEREETAKKNIRTNLCTSCWLSGDCDREKKAIKKGEVITNCRGYFIESE